MLSVGLFVKLNKYLKTMLRMSPDIQFGLQPKKKKKKKPFLSVALERQSVQP